MTHVPVLRGRLCDEQPAPLGVGGRRSGEDPRAGIPLARFADDLVDDVVGHHYPRLVRQPEALELHRAHEDGAGLAGPDDVIE